MDSEARPAIRYRKIAIAVREMAEHVSNGGDRKSLLTMARDYDAKILESEKRS